MVFWDFHWPCCLIFQWGRVFKTPLGLGGGGVVPCGILWGTFCCGFGRWDLASSVIAWF